MKIRHTEFEMFSYVAVANRTMQNRPAPTRWNLTSGEEYTISTHFRCNNQCRQHET